MKRGRNKPINNQPTRQPRSGPKAAATEQHRSAWVVNAVFVLAILGGVGYLVFTESPKRMSEPASTTGKAVDGRAMTSPAQTPSAPPQLIYEVSVNGIRTARLDHAALHVWCQKHGLPSPPNLTSLEPVVAESLMESLIQLASQKTPEAYGRLGQICENQFAHECAKEHFQIASTLNPNDFRWPYYLGCIHQLTGNNQAAIEAFETVLRLNPAYPTTHARLGQLYLESGREKDAEARVRRYLELQPNDWLGYVGLGRIALDRNEFQVALEHLQKAEQLGPGDFQVHYYLGRVYTELGQTDRAQQHFKRSNELPRGAWFNSRDPLDRELRRSAVSAESLFKDLDRLQASGDWAQLAALAEEIIRRRPDDVTMMGNLASFYRKLKRFEDAHAVLNRALLMTPDSARILLAKAEVHLAEGQHEAALQAIERLVSLDPALPQAYDVRGRAFFLLGRFTEAEAAMHQAISLRPDDPAQFYVLGEVLRSQERTAEAIEAYRKALLIQSDFAAARQRIDQLQPK